MKNILVPCDFSESSIAAFQLAVELASRNQAHVHVLRVIDLPLMDYASIDLPAYSYSPSLLQDLAHTAEKSYERLLTKFGGGLTTIRLKVVEGSTSRMILNYAEEKKIDLIVMGAHGVNGGNESFVGSNTEKIVRSAKQPVFIISKAVSISAIKNIVFPTTLKLDQTKLIKNVKALQEIFNAKLHVLYLNTPFNFVRENDLKEYAKHYKLNNFELYIRNDYYEPDGILSFVKEIKGDILAMATHGRKGLSHFLYGSITEDVANRVDCPIWTIKIE